MSFWDVSIPSLVTHLFSNAALECSCHSHFIPSSTFFRFLSPFSPFSSFHKFEGISRHASCWAQSDSDSWWQRTWVAMKWTVFSMTMDPEKVRSLMKWKRQPDKRNECSHSSSIESWIEKHFWSDWRENLSKGIIQKSFLFLSFPYQNKQSTSSVSASHPSIFSSSPELCTKWSRHSSFLPFMSHHSNRSRRWEVEEIKWRGERKWVRDVKVVDDTDR